MEEGRDIYTVGQAAGHEGEVKADDAQGHQGHRQATQHLGSKGGEEKGSH